jgi:diguanylate cyclase (GGDEF)-like protein
MVQRLCMPPPEKVAVFLAASKNKDELVLAAKIGYPEEIDDERAPVKIPKTWGRIGYAIRHQMTMDAKDFERDHIDDPPTASGQFWKTEVAAPLVSGKEILGAISVEGFGAYNKNAKKLIYVAANLGALAISLAEKTALIQHQANTDALTGLFNKRYFFERLEVEIEHARQTGKPLSVFMFDIDHFKKFNDRNGHQAGDEALKITGQLLNERRRESDTAARYGGEEFIVILPDTPKEGAYIFGESFRKIIESYPYPHGEGQPSARSRSRAASRRSPRTAARRTRSSRSPTPASTARRRPAATR